MDAFADPLPDADDTGGPAAWERALLDGQLATLDRLAEAGMAIVAAVERRATAADAPDTVLQHASMDYGRLARAVRMTLALQSRLVRDFKHPPRPPSAEPDDDGDVAPGSYEVVWLPPEPGPAPPPPPWRKHSVRGALRRLAEARGLDREALERLDAEAADWLEQDDIHGDVLNRPVDEVVALICRDLGLDPEASLRGDPVPADAASDGAARPQASARGPDGSGADESAPPFDGSS